MYSLDKLLITSPPLVEFFYSKLTRKGLAAENYKTCRAAWRTERMTMFRDFLVWYNNPYVQPFLPALDKQSAVYTEKGIEMLKDAIALLGLAVQLPFGKIGASFRQAARWRTRTPIQKDVSASAAIKLFLKELFSKTG